MSTKSVFINKLHALLKEKGEYYKECVKKDPEDYPSYYYIIHNTTYDIGRLCMRVYMYELLEIPYKLILEIDEQESNYYIYLHKDLYNYTTYLINKWNQYASKYENKEVNGEVIRNVYHNLSWFGEYEEREY